MAKIGRGLNENENENGGITGDGLIISTSVVLFGVVGSSFGVVGVIVVVVDAVGDLS